jgi:hypothetical protein
VEAGKKGVDNWGGVKLKKEVHFHWRVPDDFDDTTGTATLVVIGLKDQVFNYRVNVSLSQNGQEQDLFQDTDDSFEALVPGQLTEIDVSELLPTLTPGDYVSLNIERVGKKKVKAIIVGMRYEYEDLKTVGPQGPAGPAGKDGGPSVVLKDANGVEFANVYNPNPFSASYFTYDIPNSNPVRKIVLSIHLRDPGSQENPIENNYGGNALDGAYNLNSDCSGTWYLEDRAYEEEIKNTNVSVVFIPTAVGSEGKIWGVKEGATPQTVNTHGFVNW